MTSSSTSTSSGLDLGLTASVGSNGFRFSVKLGGFDLNFGVRLGLSVPTDAAPASPASEPTEPSATDNDPISTDEDEPDTVHIIEHNDDPNNTGAETSPTTDNDPATNQKVKDAPTSQAGASRFPGDAYTARAARSILGNVQALFAAACVYEWCRQVTDWATSSDQVNDPTSSTPEDANPTEPAATVSDRGTQLHSLRRPTTITTDEAARLASFMALYAEQYGAPYGVRVGSGKDGTEVRFHHRHVQHTYNPETGHLTVRFGNNGQLDPINASDAHRGFSEQLIQRLNHLYALVEMDYAPQRRTTVPGFASTQAGTKSGQGIDTLVPQR